MVKYWINVPAKSVLKVVISIDIIIIILALVLGETPGQYFNEWTFVTYFSSLQLLGASVVARKIFNIQKSKSKLRGLRAPYFIWGIIALAFAFMAFDEVAQVHEGIDFGIRKIFNIPKSGRYCRIDDVIIGFYGLIGIIVLYFYRNELKKFRKIFPLLLFGFFLFFCTVALNILSNKKLIFLVLTSNSDAVHIIKSWLGFFEESFKIIAEGIFLGAFYYGFEITKSGFNKWQ